PLTRVPDPIRVVMRERADRARAGELFVAVGVLPGRYLGEEDLPCLLTLREASQHVLVSGKTGLGKSTWLETFAAMLLAAGVSILCLDPHGMLDALLIQLAAARG